MQGSYRYCCAYQGGTCKQTDPTTLCCCPLPSPLTSHPLQLFRSFDRRPIAAASLGQVHRAVLHSGEEVVVKVQRPGLKALFDIDLGNLKILAQQLDKQSDDNSDFTVGAVVFHIVRASCGGGYLHKQLTRPTCWHTSHAAFDYSKCSTCCVVPHRGVDSSPNNFLSQGIYEECASVLYDEIDYIKEGRNADRFRRNFKDTPWVRVPVIHW